MVRSKEMNTSSNVQTTVQAAKIMKRERNVPPPKKQNKTLVTELKAKKNKLYDKNSTSHLNEA